MRGVGCRAGAHADLASVAADTLKLGFAALCTVAVEAARAVVDGYLDRLGALRDGLGIVDGGPRCPPPPPPPAHAPARAVVPIASVVDVDWRLDYSVRASSSGRVTMLMYVVKLKVSWPGRVGAVAALL